MLHFVCQLLAKHLLLFLSFAALLLQVVPPSPQLLSVFAVSIIPQGALRERGRGREMVIGGGGM